MDTPHAPFSVPFLSHQFHFITFQLAAEILPWRGWVVVCAYAKKRQRYLWGEIWGCVLSLLWSYGLCVSCADLRANKFQNSGRVRKINNSNSPVVCSCPLKIEMWFKPPWNEANDFNSSCLNKNCGFASRMQIILTSFTDLRRTVLI